MTDEIKRLLAERKKLKKGEGTIRWLEAVTRIDRSTLDRILNGSRYATDYELDAIAEALEVTKAQLKYKSKKYGV